ncbi:MAG TPA: ABC transporter ATP-binding protein [bacterium]|nr:ABC transporter ATP-binding protein [bacterium]
MNEVHVKTILSARQIIKDYPVPGGASLRILKGIDLEIHASEILAVVGESGAGKSTLLHLLGGLDRPTEGSVAIGNTDISRMNDSEIARFRNRHIGFVFQFHHLLPEFTALENVAMPGLIQRGDPKTLFNKATKLLAEVGLAERTTHKPRELSGGEQQRVAFARALINDPVLVLADEPSGNLDINNSTSLHRLMWKLVREKGCTFLVATHNRELAKEADRRIELSDGRIRIG